MGENDDDDGGGQSVACFGRFMQENVTNRICWWLAFFLATSPHDDKLVTVQRHGR